MCRRSIDWQRTEWASRSNFGLAVFVGALTLTPIAWADFEDGLRSLRRGEYANALSEWRPLAEHGDARAQREIAGLYLEGHGVARDTAEAVHWMQRAADGGDAAAQFQIGEFHDQGIGGLERNATRAASWYLRAADGGNVDAQRQLAICYLSGYGVPRDEQRSTYWAERAAIQNDMTAQFLLAGNYLNGIGVTRDDERAAYWYLRAAMKGHLVSQRSIGAMYAKGRGVERDPVVGFAWLLVAARNPDGKEGRVPPNLFPPLLALEQAEAARLANAWTPGMPIVRIGASK